MLKFEKNGKKLMEMDAEGNVIFHDKAFQKKMGKLNEKKVDKEQGEVKNETPE